MGGWMGESKEEINLLVSIFNKLINFKDLPQIKNLSYNQQFSKQPSTVETNLFQWEAPQLWRSSGSPDRTREASGAGDIGILLTPQ